MMLRDIPDDLHHRLKAVAAAHQRSVPQQAMLALESALSAEASLKCEDSSSAVAGTASLSADARPDLEQSLAWLRRELWALPVRDARPAEAILDYNNDGLCN
nr:hypothetical protein [Thiorhodovibrio frisius]